MPPFGIHHAADLSVMLQLSGGFVEEAVLC
jgi:hypothetical protein